MTVPICINCSCFISGKAHRDYDNHHEKKYWCDDCYREYVDEELDNE